MSAQQPDPGSSDRKPSWWKPTGDSWASPWSLSDDPPPAKNRAKPPAVEPPPTPLVSRVLKAPIPVKQEPEPLPAVAEPAPPFTPSLPAPPAPVGRVPGPFEMPPVVRSEVAADSAPSPQPNHLLEEAPRLALPETEDSVHEEATRLEPEPGHLSGGPLQTRRRMSLPPVQPPGQPVADKPISPPPTNVRRPRSEGSERPLRPFLESEPDLNLPPQVGEWPPRRRKGPPVNPWRRMIVFALGVFVFTVTAWLYWQDDQPPEEVTLQIKRIRDDTEASPTIARIRVLLSSVVPLNASEVASQPPWMWETRVLSPWLDQNVTARENLRDLLEEPDWHPNNIAWYAEDLGSHPAWATLAILKQAEAAYLMRRGEEIPAFASAIDLAALARMLQEVHAWPSYYERSFLVHEKSCQTLADLLRASALDPQRLGQFQDEFVRCSPVDELLRDQVSSSYLFEKKLMLGRQSGEPADTLPGALTLRPPGRLFFKTNRTLRLFEATFLDLRDQVGRSPWSGSGQARDRVDRLRRRVGMPNSAGESYFARRIESYLPLPDKQRIAHARHEVVTTLFALRRFLIQNKRLPPRLINLVQDKFLSEIPDDPFSGQPLRYSDATGILSSVGTNYTSDESAQPVDPPLADPKELSVNVGRLQVLQVP